MSDDSHRAWPVQLRTILLLLVSGLWLLGSLSALAIVDENANGLSDLWERKYNNGDLYPDNFDPQADTDGDGWTNAQEAAAGTDPAKVNPPGGFLHPDISIPPATPPPPTPTRTESWMRMTPCLETPSSIGKRLPPRNTPSLKCPRRFWRRFPATP